MAKEEIYDCIVLGGGPAGMSGALYAHRGGLNCVIIDISSIGGNPANYGTVENYLGLNEIQGFELCEKFEEHIDKFNIKKFPYEELQNIDLISPIKKIETIEKTFLTKSVIIATGAKNKKLNIKGEQENIGKGVSYCAVCDGAFCKEKTVCVIGGGNSALEEALYLTKFAKKVYLVHRRDTFRADKIIQDKVFNNKKIELVLNCVADEILADKRVYAINLKNTLTNKIQQLKVDSVFPYIGLEPNCEIFSGQIKQDMNGFILTDEMMKTNIEGVFAIGDVRNTPLRQIITAVSDGAVAGVEAAKYLMRVEEKVRK